MRGSSVRATVGQTRIPDFTLPGGPQSVDGGTLVEVKLRSSLTNRMDPWRDGQREAYERIAEQHDMDFEVVESDDCAGCGGPSGGDGVPVPTEDEEERRFVVPPAPLLRMPDVGFSGGGGGQLSPDVIDDDGLLLE